MFQLLKLKLLPPYPWCLAGGTITECLCKDSVLATQRTLPPGGQKLSLASLWPPRVSSQPTETQATTVTQHTQVSAFNPTVTRPFVLPSLAIWARKPPKSMGQQASYRPARRGQGFISILTLGSKHSLRPGYSAATWVHNSMCCVENYTLMMYFHASVPRKRLGTKGSSMGERVRPVNIGGKDKRGKREFVSLFTELSNFSVIQKLNFKILALQP